MENTKVNVFLKTNKPKLLASATVSLETVSFGIITIKGFCIWKSSNLNTRLQDCVNITPPANIIGGKWISQVFFENMKKWEEIECLVYGAYSRKLTGVIKNNQTPEKIADEVDIYIKSNLNINS